jgi:hypothetical protein
MDNKSDVNKKFCSRWSKSEIEALSQPGTHAEIAAKLGRTLASVTDKRHRLGIKNGPSVSTKEEAPEPTYEDDKQRATDFIWKQKYQELHRKYSKAVKENSLVTQLVSEIQDAAPVSYTPAPVIKQSRVRGKSTEQAAVLLFSDTHIGKVTLPSQTLDFGCYNFSVFLARLKYLEESVISILQNHTTMKVTELVIAMLGDMLDGALLHGVEAGQRNTLFAQYYAGGHAIAQFLRAIAAHVPKIRIETVCGNHTRWQNQKRMPTENRYSNLDMFLYALLEALTRDIPNISWNLTAQPFAIFQVEGWTIHGSHGDHLRGGDKALGIPNHAIAREISTKTQLFAKHTRQAPHYYVSGHLHRGIQLPHALGDVMINGGFPGLDNYSLTENFNPVDPTQTFFFVHPRYGKTAEYSLSLKFAEETKEPPYTIPSKFPLE